MATIGVVAGLAACIDDPAAVDDRFPLTQEDAELLGLTFWRDALEAQIEVDIGGPAATSPAGPQLAPEVFTVSDTTTAACELAGEVHRTIDATATIDVEAGTQRLEVGMTLTHIGCREPFDGRTFTFYGAPHILAGVTSDSDGQQEVLSGSLEGSVVVLTGGLPLFCDIEVLISPEVIEEAAVTYRTTGTFCGQVIDEISIEQGG